MLIISRYLRTCFIKYHLYSKAKGEEVNWKKQVSGTDSGSHENLNKKTGFKPSVRYPDNSAKQEVHVFFWRVKITCQVCILHRRPVTSRRLYMLSRSHRIRLQHVTTPTRRQGHSHEQLSAIRVQEKFKDSICIPSSGECSRGRCAATSDASSDLTGSASVGTSTTTGAITGSGL